MSKFDLWLDRLAKMSCIGSLIAQFVFGTLALRGAARQPPPPSDSRLYIFFAAWVLTTLTSVLLFVFAFRKKRTQPTEVSESRANLNPTLPAITTSDLLTSQAHEIAKIRLEELADEAIMLVRLVPTKTANQSTSAHLWSQFVGRWRAQVVHVLQNHWGNDVVEYFASADGFNKHEAVGDILEVAANPYRELLHSQKTLKDLRRTLK